MSFEIRFMTIEDDLNYLPKGTVYIKEVLYITNGQVMYDRICYKNHHSIRPVNLSTIWKEKINLKSTKFKCINNDLTTLADELFKIFKNDFSHIYHKKETKEPAYRFISITLNYKNYTINLGSKARFIDCLNYLEKIQPDFDKSIIINYLSLFIPKRPEDEKREYYYPKFIQELGVSD